PTPRAFRRGSPRQDAEAGLPPPASTRPNWRPRQESEAGSRWLNGSRPAPSRLASKPSVLLWPNGLEPLFPSQFVNAFRPSEPGPFGLQGGDVAFGLVDVALSGVHTRFEARGFMLEGVEPCRREDCR